VKPWPEKQYGSFYSGDSYIVLHTYVSKDDDVCHYDVHFWLGQNTTMDEAGTAAYKTVELDNYLEGAAIQHREVEGYESPLFLSYFPHGVFILEGGIGSGFFHVEPESYIPRLLHVKGCFKHVHTRQVKLSRDSLNHGDVFILDTGAKIYQWNGERSGGFEKHKAAEVVVHLKEKRGFHIELIVIDDDSPTDDDETFWSLIGGKGEIKQEDPNSDILEKKTSEIKLVKLIDIDGNITYELIAQGHHNIKPEMFDNEDVFILDKGYIVYVVVGGNAPQDEKKKALGKAQQYVQENHDGTPIPISVVPHEKDPNYIKKLIKE